jgi:ribosomal protein S6
MESQSPREWGKQVYELGYLLVPSLAEENLAAEAQTIKSIIEKAGGGLIAEDVPAPISLAYRMTAGGGQKKTFDKAYFAWIKFHAPAAAIEVITTQCRQYPHFLRFMIVKTVKDSSPVSSKPALKVIAADSSKVFSVPSTAPVGSPAPSKANIDEVELDKSIEQLIVE